MILLAALQAHAAPALIERFKTLSSSPADEEPVEAIEEATVAAPEPLPIKALADVGVRYPSQRSATSVGSLWMDDKASDLLGMEASARQVGDLVTVYIVESHVADTETTTNSASAKNRSGSLDSLFGIETSVLNANPNMGGSIGFGWTGEAGFDGGGSTGSTGTVTAVVTCEVVEVMPNGNLRIYGTKQLNINKNADYITLQALAQPQDIQLDNTITSERLARMELEILPRGHLGDRARPGIVTRAADVAFPF